jgi:hypothetical protein
VSTSNGTPVVVRLLAEQKRRCLATILGAAEGLSGWKDLNPEERELFRDQVRGALNILYDLSRDVIKVTDDTGLRNDLALELIAALHAQRERRPT